MNADILKFIKDGYTWNKLPSNIITVMLTCRLHRYIYFNCFSTKLIYV